MEQAVFRWGFRAVHASLVCIFVGEIYYSIGNPFSPKGLSGIGVVALVSTLLVISGYLVWFKVFPKEGK